MLSKGYEIDDIQDLDIAESIFTPDEDEHVRRMQQRYGGYWRYPKLLDFSYSVNPYFPPERMKDELRANFDMLLTEYPSGMRVNSLLAAKNYSVHQENVLTGNGAADLLMHLMDNLDGKTGFIHPTFDEYPNRYLHGRSVDFIPENKDYAYTVDDLIQFFGDKEIQNLIVVNPDNLSGNYILKADLLRLIEWSRKKGICIVIDESYTDFADEENNTLIDQQVISANSHLFIIKSVSKTCGVPGLRLSVLVSGNEKILALMKEQMSMRDVNSFAEFYMQIEEKYKKDYYTALAKFREERARFQTELSKIRNLRVKPSQTNYIMVELDEKINSADFLKKLLIRHNILLRELTPESNSKNCLRIGVRCTEENNILLSAMKEELDSL